MSHRAIRPVIVLLCGVALVGGLSSAPARAEGVQRLVGHDCPGFGIEASRTVQRGGVAVKEGEVLRAGGVVAYEFTLKNNNERKPNGEEVLYLPEVWLNGQEFTGDLFTNLKTTSGDRFLDGGDVATTSHVHTVDASDVGKGSVRNAFEFTFSPNSGGSGYTCSLAKAFDDAVASPLSSAPLWGSSR